MSDSVAVKAFTTADSSRAAALHKLCFATNPWPDHAFTSLLNSGAEGFIAEENGEMAGIILVRAAGDEAEILTFCVHPAARRRGLGKILVDRNLQALEQRNVVQLSLEVAQDNNDAICLYAKLGFTVVGQRSGYYPGTDGPIDAYVMAKLIQVDSKK